MKVDKPNIINGVCEFCGIPAFRCEHWAGLVDDKGILIPEGQSLPTAPVTPSNAKKEVKRILIGCADFSSLTGMPMYLLNLSRGLIELGYEIHLVSFIGEPMRLLGEEIGMYLYNWNEKIEETNFSALLLNEPMSEVLLARYPDVPAYNIIHSARLEDEPISNRPQIRKYLCSKDSDVDYTRARVPKKKIDILDIPIQMNRFKKLRNNPKGMSVLAVCTLDKLRTPMLDKLIEMARKDKDMKLVIKGRNCGYKIPKLTKNVSIEESESLDLQKHFDNCTHVAGIFQGTITLEGWALGKKALIFDEEGKYIEKDVPKNFKEKHNYKNVAQKLVDIMNEKWADIIVPHHDQPDLLSQLLKSIPIKNYNIIIYRGSYFSKACNTAAKLAKTETLIFSNDDVTVNPRLLWEVCDSLEDVVGVKQIYPNGNDLCLGIKIDKHGHYALTSSLDEVGYPSGAFFKMSKKMWDTLNGFDEEYINGGEDQDLFLRAIEAGASMSYIENPVRHHCSQSSGRFDYLEHNDKKFYKKWTRDRLEKIFGKFYEDKE